MSTRGSSVVQYAVVIGSYWVVAITMVFVTKRLMSDSEINSNISVLLVWTQNVISVSCIAIPQLLFYLLGRTWNGPKFETNQLLYLDMICGSLTFTGTLVFNNLMLKYISVAFYQVARSLTLIFVIMFSSFLLKERISNAVALSCFFIITGFYISVDVEIFSHGVPKIGIVYGVLASLMAALCGVFFKRVQKKLRIGSMQLALNNSIISCTTMTPLMIFSGQLNAFMSSPAIASWNVWCLIVISGVISLVMSWISALQITVITPLSHNVSINAKSVFMTLMAVAWSGEGRSLAWWLGNAFVVAGIATYMSSKLKATVPSNNEKVYTAEDTVPQRSNHNNSPSMASSSIHVNKHLGDTNGNLNNKMATD